MKELKTENDLQNVLKESESQTILIYKHSINCHISGAAKERLEEGLSDGRLKMPIYILTVQESRDISEKIAEEFEIKHETPQVIVVKNRVPIYNESHYKVDPDIILENIKS